MVIATRASVTGDDNLFDFIKASMAGINQAMADMSTQINSRFDSVLVQQQYFKDEIQKTSSEMPMIKFPKQEGTVQEYHDAFKSLISRLGLTIESLVVSLFLEELQPEIKENVKFFKPKTLSDAYCLAKLQESTHNFVKTKSNPPLNNLVILDKLYEEDDKDHEDGSKGSSDKKNNNSDLVVIDEFGKEGDKSAETESLFGVGFDQASAVDDNFGFMLPSELVHEDDVVKEVHSKDSSAVRKNNVGLVVIDKFVTAGVKRSVIESFGPDFFVHGNLDIHDGESPIGNGSKINELVGNSFSLRNYQDSWNDQIFPIYSRTVGIGNEVVLLVQKIEELWLYVFKENDQVCEGAFVNDKKVWRSNSDLNVLDDFEWKPGLNSLANTRGRKIHCDPNEVGGVNMIDMAEICKSEEAEKNYNSIGNNGDINSWLYVFIKTQRDAEMFGADCVEAMISVSGEVLMFNQQRSLETLEFLMCALMRVELDG